MKKDDDYYSFVLKELIKKIPKSENNHMMFINASIVSDLIEENRLLHQKIRELKNKK